MVLVLASIKTSHKTGKIIHGKVHATVIDNKQKDTVLKTIAQFNEHPHVGIPEVIWTDRGSEFLNDTLQQYPQKETSKKYTHHEAQVNLMPD